MVGGVQGKIAQATDFTASPLRYLEVSNRTDLSFGNGTQDSPFSISVWVNLDTLSNNRIFSKSGTSGAYEYLLGVDGSGKLSFILYDDNGANSIRVTGSDMTSWVGKWCHVAATYDGSGNSAGLKSWLNGVNVSSSGSTNGTYVAMANFDVAATAGWFAYPPEGGNVKLDELRLCSGERSPSWLWAEYQTVASNGTFNTAGIVQKRPCGTVMVVQ